MATKNFVPRATGQGQIGTTSKKWDKHIAISGAYSYVSSSGTGSFNHLLVGGNSVLSGDLTLGGDITIGDAATDSVTITADLSSILIPDASDAYNLGSATQRWNNLFLSGSISASGGPHHLSGNVGLGNYAPTTTLSVTGDISGSSQLIILGNITGSGNLEVAGNISGSATSTGSFGYLIVEGPINASGTVRADSFQSVTGGTTIAFNDDINITGNITGSGNLEVAGNISGSATSTGSFGELRVSSTTLTINNVGTVSGSATSTGSFGRVETAGNINTVGRIYESGTSVIDHATAMAIVFGG